ncbi:hypothetical protein [Tenuifilum osseticum]|uniref:hypothetical protein n=1 Tax=Tenuifilum osseticum TaxID=3374723 RepID=UPI0034E53327
MKGGLNSTVFILLLSSTIQAQNSLPQVASGTIERVENFPSRFISSRNIDIWLPVNYSSSKKYAVLYMHDGQMLYDSTTTWNKQAWEIDDVASVLMAEYRVKNLSW